MAVILRRPFRRSSLLDGLLAFWNLENVSDNSGNGNLLTSNAGVTFIGGKIENAATLVSASSQYLNLAALSSPINTGSSSIWFRSSNTGNASRFWELGTTNNRVTVVINTGGTVELFGQRAGSTAFQIVSGGGFMDGNWHNAIAVWNASGATLYVDGVSVGTPFVGDATLTLPATLPLTLGTSVITPGALLFNGQLDAGGFWMRSLNAAQIAAAYNGNRGIQWPFYNALA